MPSLKRIEYARNRRRSTQSLALPSFTVPAKNRTGRLTVNLPTELIERIRDAVYGTPGLTVARLMADAVRVAIARMERANALPFPKRTGKLKVGRPRLQREPARKPRIVRIDHAGAQARIAPHHGLANVSLGNL